MFFKISDVALAKTRRRLDCLATATRPFVWSDEGCFVQAKLIQSAGKEFRRRMRDYWNRK